MATDGRRFPHPDPTVDFPDLKQTTHILLNYPAALKSYSNRILHQRKSVLTECGGLRDAAGRLLRKNLRGGDVERTQGTVAGILQRFAGVEQHVCAQQPRGKGVE